LYGFGVKVLTEASATFGFSICRLERGNTTGTRCNEYGEANANGDDPDVFFHF
jgi:hypothetical protein